jgi:hypothetical protein
MLPLRGIEYSVLELAKEVDVSPETMARVVCKLAYWNILKVTTHPEIDPRPFRHTMYSINDQAPLVEAIINMDNEIIAIMLERENIDVTFKEVDDENTAVIEDADKIWQRAQQKWGSKNG